MITRKGIILAGGSGTRLFPATLAVSKQLLPVYDKPMIYYPLTTLMLANIRDILIISTPRDIPHFQDLLKDGSRWGLSLNYAIQPSPEGLAQAFLIGETFLNGSPSALILGDNIFYGSDLSQHLHAANAHKKGATIFTSEVQNPERYGVARLNDKGQLMHLEEKPKQPQSNSVVTGLYFYDNQVVPHAKTLRPSKRGELEITDLNNIYLKENNLAVEKLGQGSLWLDTGVPDSLLEASQLVKTIEQRHEIKIGCPEEIAFRKKWIGADQLESCANNLQNTPYGDYLFHILKENSL